MAGEERFFYFKKVALNNEMLSQHEKMKVRSDLNTIH